MNPEKEHRENLKEYYKFIRVCPICRKKYGADKIETRFQNNACPVCEKKEMGKDSIIEGTKRHKNKSISFAFGRRNY